MTPCMIPPSIHIAYHHQEVALTFYGHKLPRGSLRICLAIGHCPISTRGTYTLSPVCFAVVCVVFLACLFAPVYFFLLF